MFMNIPIKMCIRDRHYTEADLDWQNPLSRSSVEMKDAASRPAIAGTTEKIKEADVIFLRFPKMEYGFCCV